MEPIFIQLAIILFTAFIVSFIAKSLKQPIIIGYIIAGVIISPFLIKFGATTEVINTFSKLGIAFLLFIVGLHLNPKVIKEIGKASLIVGLGQIILTFGLGFLVAWQLLGMSIVSSAYIGIALAFSSTIIIMKLLSDKQQLDSLFGKISIGILIIQDIVAIIVLLFISSMSNGVSWQENAVKTLLGGAGLIVVLFLAGYFIIPRITKSIAKSQELLFLFSICWCFIIAALFSYFGMSIEIGALIAGVILSTTPYSTEISSKVRPLRDFFIIIFFIILGLNIQISNLSSIILNAVILSVIVLIFKPIILMFLLKGFKYTKRTNFLIGTTLAQISEFSLIILGIGVSLGHIAPEILQTSILTMVFTIVISTYMIIYSKDFYPKMARFASFFEKKNVKRKRKLAKEYDSILFGYNRIGFSILNSMKAARRKCLVVDYNPDTITTLNKFRIPCLYGDVDDPELLKELHLEKIKIAVSTIPDFEANFLLVEEIRIVNPKAIIIARAHTIEDALSLYKKGASYVLTPHFLGGEYISKMIKEIGTKEESYEKEKQRHIRNLKSMERRGQEHPNVEKN